MKYKLMLLFMAITVVLCVLVIASPNLISYGTKINITYDHDARVYRASIIRNNETHSIISWYCNADEKYYFFLPSFVSGAKIIDSCENDAPVDISEIIFMYSENIPAIFIDTEDIPDNDNIYAAKEYLYLDKNNSLPGSIEIITSNGFSNYFGEISGINGRGNSTWRDFVKRPFNFYINQEESLLGLRPGKKWTLLAMAWEGSHLNTRVSLDIATALNMPYTPGCQWVDFYLNGEYFGNYLLIEPVGVGAGRVPINDLERWNRKNNDEIEKYPIICREDEKGYLLDNGTNTDGGYIIEKEFYARYDERNCGFITGDNEFFSIKAPQHASIEQVQYIKDYFQRISDSIVKNEPDFSILDIDSFSSNAVVQEISLNKDAFDASLFFYKDKGLDKIYTGPIWDMDNTFGETNDARDGKNFVYPYGQVNRNAIWYPTLMHNEEFNSLVRSKYEDIAQDLVDIYNNRIDHYSEMIDASMHMDEIRWELKQKHFMRGGQYYSYENNLRFFKWFYASRVNYLFKQYGIDDKELRFEGDGSVHKVTLKKDDEVIDVLEINDGMPFGDLPVLDEEIYEGWFMEFNNVSYQSFLPVLEDTVIYAKKKGE